MYEVPQEEVEIYKLLGDHKHIVKHYGGTRRGIRGFAAIFMEKCGMLKDCDIRFFCLFVNVKGLQG